MTEYIIYAETIDYANQTGSGTGRPNHMFDVEANLMVNYAYDKAEGQFKLEFDQYAGNYDGSTADRNSSNSLQANLEEAFIRYQLVKDADTEVNLVLGRRPLDSDFTSKIQFKNEFDGARLRLDTVHDGVGNFHATGAIGPVHTKNDHFAYVLEAGLENIMGSGFSARYRLR